MKNIQKTINYALIADSYSLGSHWIYDKNELENLKIDWNELNAPQAKWHESKSKGDFSHYGDHAKWLKDYINTNKHFDIVSYRKMWVENMKTFQGYVDGATKETLEILKNNPNATTGSNSHDLSLVGSIAPLLQVSNNKDEFLDNVHTYIVFTHNNPTVLNVANFFASVLYDVINGSTIENSLSSTNVDLSIESMFDKAMKSKEDDTLETIHRFGHGCPVEGGFESTIHILLSYSNLKDALVSNAKAGGDSASRAMIIGMLMGAANYNLPSSWEKSVNNL